MKLIIAIIRDVDTDPVSRALMEADLRVTQIASTGGFLRRGNSTLLIGLEDEQVDTALNIIRQHCSHNADIGDKRAAIFVLNVAHYTHF